MAGIEKVVVRIPNTIAFRPPLVSIIIEYLVVVLTLAAFIYGVTSWCILKKFRHFRNYVYINAILSSFLRLAFVSVLIPGIVQIIKFDDQQVLDICRCLCTYLTAVQNYWLLVMCYIFYRDIVKVFRGNISRKYSKSSLFAWFLPLAAFVIYYTARFYYKDILVEGSTPDNVAVLVEIGIIVSPLVINCIIYVTVVCSLCRCNASIPTASNKWRRFYTATLLFVLSDVIVLASFMWDTVGLAFLLQAIMSKLQQIAIDLFLPIVRSNRELWHEFFASRLQSKSKVTNIQSRV